ncbi:AMP-dependent synthetase [Aeromicrobium phragmitis]|uniref:AMP-dependent synthetase n=1 Tax=Aeromicrobium phragmitis TaxID=2478914 RepID=A0A3L8PLW4_9ACTN|nr:AMP-binding protein [Aeromicrobium phragmitis]RLV56377.1 AMP-dependent synthetase [Aeromicrobium phragmitis]
MQPSLRPVTGTPREIHALLEQWVAEGGAPLVVRTSGSTGQPKDVVLSRDAVLASAQAALERLGGPGQWISALPPTAVGGLQVLVRSILAGEQPVFAEDHSSIPDAVAAMTGGRTYASFVPTQLFRLLASDAAPALADLDAILLGGAAAPAVLLERARELDITVVRTYGMSETSGGCVYDGVPLDGVRMRIGEGGLVELAGPVLFDGYGHERRTGEWFRTSDLGEIGADGRLRVLGRADDVVVSGGVNVPLPAVEEAVRAAPGIQDVAVVGVPDEEWGTRVVAAVVGRTDLPSVRDAVAAAGHPRAWAPRQLLILDELPLLPGGKVDRLELRRLAA